MFPQPQKFGCFGTLAAVSSVTRAIKNLEDVSRSKLIKLTGYSGLMLPIMEDLILSERNNENNYNLRDLLTFSSVCGVGLDTVPVSGDITIEQLALIYIETGAMSFRLNKPLSVRLLPMKNKQNRELTDVISPYLCNTKVFSI